MNTQSEVSVILITYYSAEKRKSTQEFILWMQKKRLKVGKELGPFFADFGLFF